MNAQIALLPGNRLHCQHGPIDLVISGDGEARDVQRAYRAVAEAFPNVLPQLVTELTELRRAVAFDAPPRLDGPVAQRMAQAVWPHRGTFITPMAAVAGAVADEMLTVMCAAAGLERAIVNNGGDIAIHLADGRLLTAGVVADVTAPAIAATTVIHSADPIRGIATSGWRGRSQSLGIADAVTVLAETAADADAVATLIANAVDVDSAAIVRKPANEIKHDSDLGARLVTVAVGPLSAREVATALDAGRDCAARFVRSGRIAAAYLALCDEVRVVSGLGADRIGCDKMVRVA